MARYNTTDSRTKRNQVQGGAAFSAPGTQSLATTTTNHTGRTVWDLDAKTEAFTRATSAFAGQDTFYEKAASRDARLIGLIGGLAVSDWKWTCDFLVWLRTEGNMRTAPVMLAVEAVRAHLGSKSTVPTGAMTRRQLIEAVIMRGDEPGEMFAYIENVVGRKNNCKPVKRGIGDAAKRLYNERNFLRYNSENRAFGFGGVTEMAQMPKTYGWQSDLIKYAIDMQHGNAGEIPETLTALAARDLANKLSPGERHAYARKALGNPEHPLYAAVAGHWEWTHSWLGDTKGASKPLTKKERWELVAPQMGIGAVVKNLRNLDEAGFRTGDAVVTQFNNRLGNEQQIKRSRLFPFRFFTAHLMLKSVTWAAGLEQALQHSLQNIPELPGKTLVLIDTSGSMQNKLSRDSVMTYAQIAALFGCALKIKNPENVNLWGFADGQFEAQATTGHSVLRCTEDFCSQQGRVGHGTQMEAAVRATYKKHDRVIIISDMQAFRTGGYIGYSYVGHTGDVASAVPAHVPVYGFNLAGGSTTPLGQGNRHSLAGITDKTFTQIPQLERLGAGSWPWMTE